MELTNSSPLYVTDASVAAMWQLRDEVLHEEAVYIQRLFRNGAISLVVADCLRYEVAGAIRKAYRTRRLSAEDARIALEAFLAIHIPTIIDDRLLVSTFNLSVQIGCSMYDAMYVALAVNLDRPLIHADRRLRNALSGHNVPSIWIEDWPIVEQAEPRQTSNGEH